MRSQPSDISVLPSPTRPIQEQPVEIVERKGTGHPDTICDAVSEQVSLALGAAYRRAFGRVLHHNVDKGLLVAGRVECRFGGGRVIEPMCLVIGDRAARGVGRRTVPVEEIAVGAAREWIRANLPRVDPLRHVRYQVELKPGATELDAIFRAPGGPLPANDTSAGVGYAPLTPTERLVVDLERYLNGPLFKRTFPETGEDVKVLAIRREQELALTVAMPLLAGAIRSEAAYFQAKARVLAAIEAYVRRHPLACPRVRVALNALDRRGHGLEGLYLSLLGTSAEQGDSGQTGRGNRVCGVIALNRPMSGEAAAGKNPVSHVGKIYNVLAHELAARIYARVPGIRDVTVWLVSRIGERIDRPALAMVQVNVAASRSLRQVRPAILRIAREGLADIEAFCGALEAGRYPLW
ncbi:methionine adenosyltransferase [Nitrospira sp. Kam-Ns4a]